MARSRKIKKGIAYLVISAIFWLFPIIFLTMLSQAIAQGRQNMIGDPTGVTQLVLFILIIIAIVFLAFGIRNIAGRNVPTFKEKLSTEKEELEDRLKKIEGKLEEDDEEKTKD